MDSYASETWCSDSFAVFKPTESLNVHAINEWRTFSRFASTMWRQVTSSGPPDFFFSPVDEMQRIPPDLRFKTLWQNSGCQYGPSNAQRWGDTTVQSRCDCMQRELRSAKVDLPCDLKCALSMNSLILNALRMEPNNAPTKRPPTHSKSWAVSFW